MKKIIIISLAAVAVVSLALFFVFKSFRSDGQVKFIPKNCYAVITVDFKSLSKKIDFEKVKSMNWFKKLQQGYDNELTFITKNIAANGESSGINFLSNPYIGFFTKDTIEQKTNIVCSFKLSNREDFEKFIKTIYPKIIIEMKNGIWMATLQYGGTYLAYNDKYATIVVRNGNDALDFITKLYNQTEDESIANQTGFDEFRSANKDFGVFANYREIQSLSSLIRPQLSVLSKTSPDINFSCVLNFVKDKIELKMKTYYKDEAVKKKYMEVYRSGCSAEHLQAVTTKNVIAFISLAFNSDKTIALLSETPEVKKVFTEAQKQLGITEKEFADILGGDLTFCLNDFKTQTVYKDVFKYETMSIEKDTVTETLPIFTIALSTKNKAVIEKIIKKYQIPQAGNSLWKIQLPMFTEWFALTDKEMLLVNDSSTAATFISNKKLGEMPLQVKTLALENTASMYINLDLKQLPESYRNSWKSMTGSAYPKVENTFSNFKDITVSAKAEEGLVEINMTNSSFENSLMRILDISEQNSK